MNRNSSYTSTMIIATVLLAFLILTVGPLLLVWLTAFKEKGEMTVNMFGLPRTWMFENIATVWRVGHFGTYYRNSLLLVVFPVCFFSILFTIMTGYGFACFPSPLKGPLFAVLLFAMAIPSEMVIIHLYYELRAMGLQNTLTGLILPQVAMGIPFGTFLIRATFSDIPRSLIDAAEIDGAGSWTTLWRILAPLLKPTIMTLAIFFFIWTWNDFFLPLVLISDNARRTLPIGMAYFQGKYKADIPIICMGATLITLPVFLVYLFLKSYIIAGMTAGAVKG